MAAHLTMMLNVDHKTKDVDFAEVIDHNVDCIGADNFWYNVNRWLFIGNEIVDDETSLPHRLLNDAPKHPQREHVEQHVRPRSVQEHIGHHLPQTKIGRQKEVQTEEIGQHIPPTLRHELLHHEENNVDKQQVARYGRNRIEESVGRHVRECISPQVTHIELCATRGRNEKKRKSSVPRGRPQATLHLEKRRSPPDKLPEFRPPTHCARLVTRWIRIRTAQF